MVTINEYTDLFMTVILGMGASFELPVLVMFLALFGIVTPRLALEEHPVRHSDHLHHCGHHYADAGRSQMCVFATPMLGLYMVGIA